MSKLHVDSLESLDGTFTLDLEDLGGYVEKINVGTDRDVEIDLDAIDSSTTRTITMPNSDVDLGDIATNAADIATNTSDISDLQSDVADNTSDLSDLNYSTTTFSLGGDFTSDDTATISRVGNVVTMTTNRAPGHSSIYTVSSSSGAIPSAYRPTTSVYNAYRGYDYIAEVQVESSGTVLAYYADHSGSNTNKSTTGTALTLSWVLTD